MQAIYDDVIIIPFSTSYFQIQQGKHLNIVGDLFKVNKQSDIKDVVLMSLLLPLNSFTYCSCVSIVGFEQVNTGWDITL